MSDEDVVLYEVSDAVAQVTLNRPEALNAWTPELGRSYFDRLQEAEAVPDVGPRERERGERAVRRLHDAVELRPVRPLVHHVLVALDRDARRVERGLVDCNARLNVMRLGHRR